MKNLVKTTPVEFSLQSLDADDAKKVQDWMENLKNWDNDPFVRLHKQNAAAGFTLPAAALWGRVVPKLKETVGPPARPSAGRPGVSEAGTPGATRDRVSRPLLVPSAGPAVSVGDCQPLLCSTHRT